MTDPFTPMELAAVDARAAVLPYGAHVTSWVTPDGTEQLFLSARSVYEAGKAIRGGVPVIFPQFSDRGPLPKHGFARARPWSAARRAPNEAVLALRDDDATRALWPHAFDAELTVTVEADALHVALAVENTGDAPLSFTGALHTYLRVDDVAGVTIEGLRGVRYQDATAGRAERVEESAALRLVGEVDRVYLDAPNDVVVREPGRSRVVSAEGFPDVVVWNPGADLAATLADLEPDGWRRFVCIEAAVVAQPVVLAPRKRWTGRQRIVVGGDAG
jgi:glucose-6-phosphate 1-epimerase